MTCKILQPDTSASVIFASALIEMSGYIKDTEQRKKITKQYNVILSTLMSKPYFIETPVTPLSLINQSIIIQNQVLLMFQPVLRIITFLRL